MSTPFTIDRVDHLVLTASDLDVTCDFYCRVLGMKLVTFSAANVGGGAAEERRALAFGAQKINLHQAGREFVPRAIRPTPGSADLCLITQAPLDQSSPISRRPASRLRKGRWPAPAPPVPSRRSISATRTAI